MWEEKVKRTPTFLYGKIRRKIVDRLEEGKKDAYKFYASASTTDRGFFFPFQWREYILKQ